MQSMMEMPGDPALAGRWKWFVGLGVVLVILGILALMNAVDATLITTIFVGWLLLLGGIAQIVAAFAKEQGLARIVGRKTRGNVLGAANFPVGSGYWLRLPVFGWFTSMGKSVEGIGVQPDVEEPIDAEALRNGEDNELARAVSVTEEAQRAGVARLFPAATRDS